MSILTQDCSELRPTGFGRVWLCRLLKPTLGKKLLLVFAASVMAGKGRLMAPGMWPSSMRWSART